MTNEPTPIHLVSALVDELDCHQPPASPPTTPVFTAERLEEEASRAAFEDWTGHSKPPERMDNGQYYSKPLQSDWRLWQGAIEYAQESLAASEAERESLQAWKDSAMQVEREWDEQKVGKLLNLPLGSSIRAGIEPAVTALIATLSSTEQENAKLRQALEDAINLIEVSTIVETPPCFSDDLKKIKAVADQKGPKA